MKEKIGDHKGEENFGIAFNSELRDLEREIKLDWN